MGGWQKRFTREKIRSGPTLEQDDWRVGFGGIVSGMTKRLAETDGKFVDVRGVPQGTRANGRLPNRNKG